MTSAPLKTDQLIGSNEVAARLGIHRDTVVKRARLDPLFPKPLRYCDGGRLFWHESTISEYVETFGKRGQC
jgi:predicted DNA-binding transcriptional regulator AlpA